MICPHCGFEIPEGMLYCEKCGEEIHIVPDFDPELENRISENLTGFLEEMETEQEKAEEEEKIPEQSVRERRFTVLLWVLPIVGILIAGSGTVIGIHHYRTTSPDYQVKLANAAVSKNNYELAIEKLQKAYELDPSQVSLLFEIADYYYLTGNVNDGVLTLCDVAFSQYASQSDIQNAYSKIVEIYKTNGDYGKLSELLEQCPDTRIRMTYSDYLASAPEFSLQGGTYDEVIPIKLLATGAGTIHYTLDGTDPGIEADIYTAPILLNPGMTTVKAVYVNPYGVRSEVVSCTYNVNVPTPAAPEVNLSSGDFNTPQIIKINLQEGTTVYYTTDLKDPTRDSQVYTEPLVMPLGRSNFKFIAYNEMGIASEVTARSYNLTIDNSIPAAQCVNALLEAFVQYGKIMDLQGHAPGMNGRYLYQLTGVVHDDTFNSDFYILPELYEDAAGVQTKTGAVYAANIYSGQLFICVQHDNVTYEIQSDLYYQLQMNAQLAAQADAEQNFN